MPMPRRRLALSLVPALLAIAPLAPLRAQSLPTVAAASDLKFAIEEVAARFERETGQKLKLVFGSSGNFYSQILQGAPFHLYMSADEDFVFRLADTGKTVDRGRLYAVGRIGVIVPHGSPLKADGELKDLGSALKDGRLRKFAIANPEHAPYGARAREALQHAGLWQAVQPKLVLGENISQTAQFATSGSTDGGIIALSLAKAPSVAKLGTFALIPEAWHQPLRQRMVLVKDAPPAARAFYDYIATPPAQEIMTRYGFSMPQQQ
ncbi:molybdate ABC transporter substrate-binding protein [Cupriavidus sp. MP-37]|uniref:molybdate ABC transporter substrate-binding protein n=1 Tax=Cupriavidus sp. MP-37 TaxID=2884455 RepID=UPI001D09D67B|nr:molybdate ABC transporter substrate-binding protein [Cupriavidus sp. MP-37]UDM53055.1 molybdate ABC transporter substrate-binding protein [Cupriavidus sp. MP-37]